MSEGYNIFIIQNFISEIIYFYAKWNISNMS